MKSRSAQTAILALFRAVFPPDVFSPAYKLSLRRLLGLDSSALRVFALRLLCGAGLGAGFSAWLYGFALLAPCFTLESPESTLAPHTSQALQTLCALVLSALVLLAYALWLIAPKVLRGYFGFFAGVMLFYWIGLSFRFSIAPMLMPAVWLGIGVVYALLFYVAQYFASMPYRIASLFALGAIAPFGFDWFVPQSWLAYSVFGVGDLAFIAILCALGIGLYSVKRRFSRARFSYMGMLLSVGVLLGCVDWQNLKGNALDKNASLEQIAIIQGGIPQDVKWELETIEAVLQSVLSAIDSAISNKQGLIVFPETILPFVLNEKQSFQREIIAALLEKSAHITIVLGAFSELDSASVDSAKLAQISQNTSVEAPEFRNSTYIFRNGEMRILHKVILAPFGEKIPLPDMLARPLYRLFFGIDVPLGQAQSPQDFEALGRIWRNAICYEGTSKLLYTNAPRYLMMISNNAWFHPSIEPYLQRVLLKYYARKFGTLIVHSANFSSSMVILPEQLSDDTRLVRPLILPDRAAPESNSQAAIDSSPHTTTQEIKETEQTGEPR